DDSARRRSLPGCWWCPGLSQAGSLACGNPSVVTPDRGKGGTGLAGQIRRCQGNFQTASAGADVDLRPLTGAVVDEGSQALLLTQWADATEQVTGAALSNCRVGHAGLLAARGPGQEFQVQLPADRHHSYQQLAGFGAGQQGLEHPGRVQAELLRCFAAVGFGLRIVVIAVQAVVDPRLIQCLGCRCHLLFSRRSGLPPCRSSGPRAGRSGPGERSPDPRYGAP